MNKFFASEVLGCSDAGFTVIWVTATLVKVLVGVCGLGSIKNCHQVFPVMDNLGAEERDSLPRPLGGELDRLME